MKLQVIAPSLGVLALVSACSSGGGGGGVTPTPPPPPTATPAPTPTPTPTPPATNTTLRNLVASQQFTNDAVTSGVTLNRSNVTTASSQGAATLTVSYDAATRSYTVASGGRTETFAPGDRMTEVIAGQLDYSKNLGSVRHYFTLTEPASAINLGIEYVGGGYWQRNETLADGLGITFDAFTYGLSTPNTAVPRTGSAGYQVNLFGFFAPLNRTPKVVIGDGSFAIDLRNGSFATSGTAHEVDLTDPYYTGEHNWRGAGLLSAASNGFSGLFAYDGRDRFSVNGQIAGRFYGPAAQELGAVFHAQDAAGTLLTGTLLGRQSAAVAVPALTVLDSDVQRSFFTSQHSVLYIRNNGATSVEGAASVFPDANGRIDFAADDSVRLVAKLSSSELPSPIFTAADRVAAESNARYTTYRSVQGSDTYRLVLYNPGAGNDELALTYASFGTWDRLHQGATREESARVWFAYGVPTATGTLARTGTAGYAMTLHGSGVTFADGMQYSLSGTAAMNVDFATMRYDGSLDALARANTGTATIDFAPLAFGGEMFNTYAFQSFLSSRPGFADGEIRGRLYGPRGEEIGASFDILHRNGGGSVIGSFAGVAVGKKN
jgi:hypothetical protein